MTSPFDARALFRVDGLVAVITGGGSGLGRIVAHALAANGAQAVYILGRRMESLNTTKSECSHPQAIIPIQCDITSKDALHAAAEQVRTEVGYCNFLFANSGVSGANSSDVLSKASELPVEQLQEALWKHSMEAFTEALHVNITGTFYTVVAFLALLSEGNKRKAISQGSHVLITTSAAAYSRKPAAGFAYGPSKAGLAHMSQQLATLFAPHKIRFNTLAPGFYVSEMTEKFDFMKHDDPTKEGSMPNSFIPLTRVGGGEDMAGTVLFMASKAGGFLDGMALLTDGGRMSIVPSSY